MDKPSFPVAAQSPASKSPVGILGGMGPEATVLLMSRVLAATPAQDDSDHVPLLVDCNSQVPSRIKALIEGTGESPGPVLAAMAARLVAMGATALAMPCNTAHAYLPEIRAAAGEVPLLDMVGLTAARLAALAPRPKRVGMLASTAVQITGLYREALADRGIEEIFPQRQAEVMEIIRAVKRGDAGAPERAALAEISVSLIAEGADALAIACTEISVIADGLPRAVPILDAIDVLAAAIADGWKNQNAVLRPGPAISAKSVGRKNREFAT
ncbi:cysteate racemase [Algihabitans albus]|uniref:aspartate/glutamate racemase family protein n=1 Tax=Algihabitans albus TaxID=2164067 RepID=UPI000E5D13CC|nr:amino acid racemase [Algihabitans albus]